MPPLILLCTGLGRVNRGFEQYIASLAIQLSQTPGFTRPLQVWSGGPWRHTGIRSRQIPNLPRQHALAPRGYKGFIGEQLSFFAGMLPRLWRARRATFYLGEYRLDLFLYKVRQWWGLRHRLILYTGGQAIPGPGLFDARYDRLHHITDVYLPQCAHIPAPNQFVIPHFIDTGFTYDASLRKAIQHQAGGKKIILSVGLLDTRIKRMDVWLKALAPQAKDYFPILLGQPSADTPAIVNLLEKTFGPGGYMLTQVPHAQLGSYYAVAHAFVLASPAESFGLALVEALYHGLPVVCLPFAAAYWVLKQHAHYVANDTPAGWQTAIENALAPVHPAADKKTFVLENYTWQSVSNSFLQLVEAPAT